MKKLKLKSSARTKKRYLVLNADSEDEVKKAILDYMGILGWAKAKPSFLRLGKKIVVSVDRKEIENVKAAFEISEILVVRVSGTIKGLKKKFN